MHQPDLDRILGQGRLAPLIASLAEPQQTLRAVHPAHRPGTSRPRHSHRRHEPPPPPSRSGHARRLGPTGRTRSECRSSAVRHYRSQPRPPATRQSPTRQPGNGARTMSNDCVSCQARPGTTPHGLCEPCHEDLRFVVRPTAHRETERRADASDPAIRELERQGIAVIQIWPDDQRPVDLRLLQHPDPRRRRHHPGPGARHLGTLPLLCHHHPLLARRMDPSDPTSMPLRRLPATPPPGAPAARPPLPASGIEDLGIA